MSTPQNRINDDALYAILKYMKSDPSPYNCNPGTLARKAIEPMVQSYFPKLSFTPKAIDTLYEVCQIIGKLYNTPNNHLLIWPNLGTKWKPHVLTISATEATVVRIMTMGHSTFADPDTWADYKAYASLPPRKRPQLKLAAAAQKVLEHMPQLNTVTATTLVCVIGGKGQRLVRGHNQILNVFQRP
jgi:hypothetical protein